MAAPNYTEQLTRAYTFYQGLPVCDAYRVLADDHIRTVFWGYDEHIPGDAVKRYPFLKQIAQFEETVLFEVIPWDDAACKKSVTS